jgi:muconolactone delta-isomerase
MEYLVEFAVEVPDGTPEAEVAQRQRAEGEAAARLADEGHLERVWRRPDGDGGATVLGLHRADSREQLDGLLAALPLAPWMRILVTPLTPHPNDPAGAPAPA